MEELCDLAVRGLEELIDYQNYPVKAAEVSTKNRRSLGVGYIGLAHYLAKQGVKYDDPAAWKIVHDLTESFQYNLLKSSVTSWQKKKESVDTTIAPSMQMVSSQSTLTSLKSIKSQED